jgi:hypothetical protein
MKKKKDISEGQWLSEGTTEAGGSSFKMLYSHEFWQNSSVLKSIAEGLDVIGWPENQFYYNNLLTSSANFWSVCILNKKPLQTISRMKQSAFSIHCSYCDSDALSEHGEMTCSCSMNFGPPME